MLYQICAGWPMCLTTGVIGNSLLTAHVYIVGVDHTLYVFLLGLGDVFFPTLGDANHGMSALEIAVL